MVPPNGVPDKRQRLPAHQVEEPGGIEHWKLAIVRLPLPLEIGRIRAPILHAILVFMDSPAAGVCVVRCLRIRNPFPFEDVAMQADRMVPRTAPKNKRTTNREEQRDTGQNDQDQSRRKGCPWNIFEPALLPILKFEAKLMVMILHVARNEELVHAIQRMTRSAAYGLWLIMRNVHLGNLCACNESIRWWLNIDTV